MKEGKIPPLSQSQAFSNQPKERISPAEKVHTETTCASFFSNQKDPFNVRRTVQEKRAGELTSYANTFSTYNLTGHGEWMHLRLGGKNRDEGKKYNFSWIKCKSPQYISPPPPKSTNFFQIFPEPHLIPSSPPMPFPLEALHVCAYSSFHLPSLCLLFFKDNRRVWCFLLFYILAKFSSKNLVKNCSLHL